MPELAKLAFTPGLMSQALKGLRAALQVVSPTVVPLDVGSLEAVPLFEGQNDVVVPGKMAKVRGCGADATLSRAVANAEACRVPLLFGCERYKLFVSI